MLKRGNELWNQISFSLKDKSLSYEDIARNLGATTDQIKYVSMTEKIYKKASPYLFKDPGLKSMIRNIILDSEKRTLTYKEIAFEINGVLHKKSLLPQDIQVSEIMVMKWRKKLDFKNKNLIIKKDSLIYKEVIELAKLRKYTAKEIARRLNLKQTNVESIINSSNIRKTVFNTLIRNEKGWNYFKKRCKELYDSDLSYAKMSKILNKELHESYDLPKEISLTEGSTRELAKYKLKLSSRHSLIKGAEFKMYKNSIIQQLNNNKIISKSGLDNFMHKKFGLDKKSCEKVYLRLRWKRIIASTIERPLSYTLVDWGREKYQIKECNDKRRVCFTGRGRLSNADLIREVIISFGYPLTYSMIVSEMKKKFKLEITGRDLGVLVNNERRRCKFSGKKPKIDTIVYGITNTPLSLYIVPKIITTDKITIENEKKLLSSHQLGVNEHLRWMEEGRQLDKCVKNIACELWGFRRDVVLNNKKRPDLLLGDRIVDIKKVVDTNIINCLEKKYAAYGKTIEIWYLEKRPWSLTSNRPNIRLKSIKQVLDKVNKPLPNSLVSDCNLIYNSFLGEPNGI